MNLLFVCTGNTCRSPMAEALCHRLVANGTLAERNINAYSAGIYAQAGESITPEAVEALEKLEIFNTQNIHKATPLTQALVNDANIIFVMEEHHKAAIEERFPEVASKVRLLDQVGIIDPFGKSQEVYDKTLEQIRQAIVKFLQKGV